MKGLHSYIITGGPGAGKTSVLEALQQMGFPCFPEASRQVIMEEVAAGSGCVPWTDLPGFADKVLHRMTLQYRTAAACTGTAFFDRGIPDIIAYLRVGGCAVPESYFTAVQTHAYAPSVFILPPWKEIYVNDPERWQSFAEATAIYHAMRETYQHFGYRLITIAPEAVALRAQEIARTVQLEAARTDLR